MPYRLPLEEAIAEERNPATLNDGLGPIRLARRMLLQGETLVGKAFADLYGCSSTVVSQAARQLEHLGYNVEEGEVDVKDDGDITRHLRTFRVSNPAHKPTAADFENLRDVQRAYYPTARPKATNTTTTAVVPVSPPPTEDEPPLNGSAVPSLIGELPPLPAFGASVVISALVSNRDGTITLGLRDDRRSWTATITAVVEDGDG